MLCSSLLISIPKKRIFFGGLTSNEGLCVEFFIILVGMIASAERIVRC